MRRKLKMIWVTRERRRRCDISGNGGNPVDGAETVGLLGGLAENPDAAQNVCQQISDLLYSGLHHQYPLKSKESNQNENKNYKLLLTPDTLDRISLDILRMSGSEPSGVRGCVVRTKLQRMNSSDMEFPQLPGRFQHTRNFPDNLEFEGNESVEVPFESSLVREVLHRRSFQFVRETEAGLHKRRLSIGEDQVIPSMQRADKYSMNVLCNIILFNFILRKMHCL